MLSAGPVDLPVQGGTTTVRTSLPAVTSSWDVAALGSATTGPLLPETLFPPSVGTGVFGLGTNAADGSRL